MEIVPFNAMMRRSNDPSVYVGLFRRAAIHFDLASISDQERHRKRALKLADDLVKKMVAAQKRLRFSPRAQDLKRYLDRRLPMAQCMRLGLKVALLKGPAELTGPDQAELRRLTGVLAESTDLYSSYNLACTYALFAALDTKYQSLSFHYLERMFYITKSLESLGARFVGLRPNMAKRATNDAAFEHLWNNPEFKRIVSPHLDTKQMPA
jgi:hypothetical protein